MSLAAKIAGIAAAYSPLGHSSLAAKDWRPSVNRIHSGVAILMLSGTSLICLASPLAGEAIDARGGVLLLAGGALIGVPHGSSDFVVGHKLLRPAFGWRWLPCFLAVYLALVAATMSSWTLSPLATLLGFLALSGLHFGWSDMRAAPRAFRYRLAFAVRATTPVLPIFLIHPAGVSGFIAALAGLREGSVVHVLRELRWPLILPWGAALLAATLPPLIASAPRLVEALPAVEILATALAAAVLPPLVAFGLYFCLIHSVRHMLELAEDHHPQQIGAAALLVAGVVVPMSMVTLAALYLTWNGLAGLLDTKTVLIWGLRIIAALTVPHMMLEWIVATSSRRSLSYS